VRAAVEKIFLPINEFATLISKKHFNYLNK